MCVGSGARAVSAAESGDITADSKNLAAVDFLPLAFLRMLSPKWGRLSRLPGMVFFSIASLTGAFVPRIRGNPRQHCGRTAPSARTSFRASFENGDLGVVR